MYSDDPNTGPVFYSNDLSVPGSQMICIFADDNYTIRWSKEILISKIKLEDSLFSLITSWFKASGLKVNESKTEICLLSRGHVVPIEISLNGETISTKSTINVLGLIFFTEKFSPLLGLEPGDHPGTKPICYQLSYPG